MNKIGYINNDRSGYINDGTLSDSSKRKSGSLATTINNNNIVINIP